MSEILSEENCFLFPELKFPSNLSCSKIFNMIFQDGYSFNQIEDYANYNSKTTQTYQDPNLRSLIQYNLKTDNWGPLEVALLGISKIPEIDFTIAFGCRDNNQLNLILAFLYSHPNISIYNEEEGNHIFLFQNNKTNLLNKLVMINVQKDRTQSIKVGLTLKA